MGRLAIYTRLSQVRDGMSEPVKRQEADCRKLAKLHGWDEPRIYTDLDLSAWKGVRRPRFEDLLEAMEAGEVDRLLVWKLDRLVRRAVEFERVLAVIEHAEVTLVSVHDSLDTSTPMGQFMARLLVGVGQMESENTAIRVRSAKKQGAEQGKPQRGGARPFGWQDDRVTPHPTEAPILREIATRVLSGEPMRTIIADINQRDGVRLHRMNVRRALTSPRAVGAREHHGEIVAWDAWEPLLDRETWERLRVVLPAWNKRGRPVKYLLAGMLRCGREGCGAMLHALSGGRARQPTYACKVEDGHAGCGKLSVSAAAVERVVVDDLMSLWEDSDRLKELLAEPEVTQDERLTATIDQLEERLEEFAQDRARGNIGRKEYLAARDVIISDLDRARGRLARRVSRGALQEIPGTRAEMEQAWESWDLDRRRLVLSAFIASITVEPTTVRGRRFDEDRVRIDWRV